MFSARLIISIALITFNSGCSSPITPLSSGTPVVAAPAGDAKGPLDSSDISSQLRRLTKDGQLGGSRTSAGYRLHVQSIYESTNFTPLWFKNGESTPQAKTLIERFLASQEKGLNPADYEAEKLEAASRTLKTVSVPDQALFDVSLTTATARYISDLRVGRVNPKHLKFGIDVEAKKYDLTNFITTRVTHAEDVRSVLDGVEPLYAGYRRLETSLKQYLAMLSGGDGAAVPAGLKTILPNDPYAGTIPLAIRLRLLGDLSGVEDFQSYTGQLVEGVKHFQARHGLPADGKLDGATLRELNTPLTARVQQIEDALERWRWMPTEFTQPPVIVNIPEFRLRAYSGNQQPELMMNVVVGKSAPTQTPIFTDTIRYIVFRPYWNVPPGILRRTVIPGILKSSGYVARERFEVTNSKGTSVPVGGDLVVGLRSGKYAIRQKPGPANALGLVKFMFPNSHSVYLHSSPSTELFAKSRRDFSSGCIRVEKPAELANFLLRKQLDGPQPWTTSLAQSAMDSGNDNRQVNLAVKIPVLILYVTAVAEEDGTIHFFNDIYGHDKRLNSLLVKGPPYP